MDPATLTVLGVMAASSAAQAYQSHKARGASQKELDKLEQAYNAIKPADYDLSIQDPPELHAEMLKQPQFSDPVAAPKFDMSRLTPEDQKVIGRYAPEAADYISEAAPETIQKTEGMRVGRDAQMNALKRFMDIGQSGYDPEYQEAVTRSGRQAQAEAQSRQQSLMQDFARRGQGGSGLQFAAQLGAGSQAMDRNAMANLSASTQAYKNRLSALSQGATLGGQIGQQDLGMQQANVGIINEFNQRMTAGRQAWETQRANLANQAQLANLNTAQGLANQNVNARNQAAVSNRSRQDELARYGYQVGTQQQHRQDDIARDDYRNRVSARDYQNIIAQQQYGNKVADQTRRNSLVGQKQQDELARAGLRAGVSTQRSQLAQQGAQDINQLLQGVSNVAGVYGTSNAAQNAQNASNLGRMQSAKMGSTGQMMTDEELEAYKKQQEMYG